ncbi:PREDICTED: nucleoside diphosphate kinase, mitochondrial isoform X1 [Hipposideros armiger]|uniref:Nucleoside diphosphate kinase n=2 Tax=Hipposideros armiger TaxID=186990 RepID=A0A8B7RTE5_HIPAR|nr:PREDICTED: nucleoside diphosphate kinase, mitochondrial isoform X1 [Hipposideros armiger]
MTRTRRKQDMRWEGVPLGPVWRNPTLGAQGVLSTRPLVHEAPRKELTGVSNPGWGAAPRPRQVPVAHLVGRVLHFSRLPCSSFTSHPEDGLWIPGDVAGGPSWNQERTLVAVKPDGVHRRLVGDVIQRFERRGFKLVGMKMLQVPKSVLAEHYHDLQKKPFYPALISYMSSGPVVAMVWEGPNVVCTSRAMIGHTDSAEAAPGTIRGDFSVHISRNVIHASDSVDGAQREIQLWFQSNELVDWADEGHRSSLYPA